MSTLIKKNVGTADAIIRIILAGTIGILSYMGWVSGGIAIALGVAAVIFLVTGFVNFCPLYAALGIKSKK